MDADKSSGSLEKPDCRSPLRRLSKDIVEVLLDISEENFKDLEVYKVPNQTGWDEAIQGWAPCSPFSCLFTAQQKRKVKPDSPASHCVLCANLRDLNPSENVALNHGASEASCRTSKEHWSSNVPPLLEHLHGTPSAMTATSCSGEKPPDFTAGGRSAEKDLLDNEVLFGPDQFTPDKLLSHLHQREALCLFLEDRDTGKALLPGRVMVLPPVKVASSSNTNPKNSKTREDGGDTRAAAVAADAGADRDREKEAVSSYLGSSSQGSVPSRLGPTQYQHYLLSDLNHSGRYQIPIGALAETQPGAAALRLEDLITASVQHKPGHRPRLCSREKSLRRPEPQLPVLLGTRMHIPVSAQRLL